MAANSTYWEAKLNVARGVARSKGKDGLFWRCIFGILLPPAVVNIRFLPDPFFMHYIQEFWIKQGVVRSQTRVNLGFVWIIFWKRGLEARRGSCQIREMGNFWDYEQGLGDSGKGGSLLTGKGVRDVEIEQRSGRT